MTGAEVQRRIMMLLDERDWSPTHLAKVSGLPTTTVTDIFKRKSCPKIETLDKLCKGFGITVGDFFAFDITPSPKMTLTPTQTRIMMYAKKFTEQRQERVIDFMSGMMTKKELEQVKKEEARYEKLGLFKKNH